MSPTGVALRDGGRSWGGGHRHRLGGRGVSSGCGGSKDGDGREEKEGASLREHVERDEYRARLRSGEVGSSTGMLNCRNCTEMGDSLYSGGAPQCTASNDAFRTRPEHSKFWARR
jgi:hypothetical protein